jgi:hypothetical protein
MNAHEKKKEEKRLTVRSMALRAAQVQIQLNHFFSLSCIVKSHAHGPMKTNILGTVFLFFSSKGQKQSK